MHVETLEIERFAIDKKLCLRHFDSPKSNRQIINIQYIIA
jgi:hypothetical protein